MYGDEFLANSRPGIDVQSIVFTDEKFFRVEQDDRQQRVWLDSVTTKNVRPRPLWSVIRGSKRVQGFAYIAARFFQRNWPLLFRTLFWRCHVASVMVSAGVCGKATPQLLGPFFIEDSCKIDSGVCCRFFGEQLRASDVAHSSASCVARGQRTSHRSKATRDWKKANFSTPDLGWPPQSPDLAPMDYSIWQAVVSAHPAERSSSKAALKAAIASAFAVVAASDAPGKAVSAFKNRLQQCLDADGGHFEALVFTDVAFLVRVKK